MLLIPAPFIAAAGMYSLSKYQLIQDDLNAGITEEVKGVVEAVSGQDFRVMMYGRPWLMVAGETFAVSTDARLDVEPGDQITVEYLPRSKVALAVTSESLGISPRTLF